MILTHILTFVAGCALGAALVRDRRTSVGRATLPPRPSRAPVLLPKRPEHPTPPPPPKWTPAPICSRRVGCSDCPHKACKFHE